MMNRLKQQIFVILLVLLAALLLSCGSGGVPDEELIGALKELEPRAREMYGIVYGDNLPRDEESEGLYYKVAEDSPYQTIEELKAAMSGIFSPDYQKVLSNTAFESVSLDDGTIIHAKFMVKEDGLYVNPSATEDFGKPRSFDMEQITVVKKNPYRAILSLTAVNEAGESETLEVNLQKVDGVWLLDSPLF